MTALATEIVIRADADSDGWWWVHVMAGSLCIHAWPNEEVSKLVALARYWHPSARHSVKVRPPFSPGPEWVDR